MSNSRIFCVAWMVLNLLVLIATMAGLPPVYEGIDRLIAQSILGVFWGITAVALFGDRKAKP